MSTHACAGVEDERLCAARECCLLVHVCVSELHVCSIMDFHLLLVKDFILV